MKKQSGSPRKKSKIPPLWQLGLLLIVVGPLASMVTGMILPAPVGSAAARGQAFGRGFVALLAIIAGIVLIIVHFVRGSGGKQRDREEDDDVDDEKPKKSGRGRKAK